MQVCFEYIDQHCEKEATDSDHGDRLWFGISVFFLGHDLFRIIEED